MLVIDDEPLVRMLVTDVLREQGYIVIEAHDGPSGLKVVESVLRVDLLITDIAQNAAIKDGHADAAVSVLTKPFTMAALAGRVKGLLDQAIKVS